MDLDKLLSVHSQIFIWCAILAWMLCWWVCGNWCWWICSDNFHTTSIYSVADLFIMFYFVFSLYLCYDVVHLLYSINMFLATLYYVGHLLIFCYQSFQLCLWILCIYIPLAFDTHTYIRTNTLLRFSKMFFPIYWLITHVTQVSMDDSLWFILNKKHFGI